MNSKSNIFLDSLGGIGIPIWLTNDGLGDTIIGRVARLGIGTAGEDVDVVEKVGNVAMTEEVGSIPISVEAKEQHMITVYPSSQYSYPPA